MMGYMPERDIARTGSYVAARRGDLGMSQEDLAKAANVDVKTVRDFELGKRWPWSKTRSAIARALQMSTLDLQAAADGEPERTAGGAEAPLTGKDDWERAVLASDRLSYAEKAAAIRDHREITAGEARKLAALGVEPPMFLRGGVRHLAGESASSDEARGA